VHVNLLVVESGSALSHAVCLYPLLRVHRHLFLSNNALTTLPANVFDALGSLRYVSPSPAHALVLLLSVRGNGIRACC